jgi:hypothetical protein
MAHDKVIGASEWELADLPGETPIKIEVHLKYPLEQVRNLEPEKRIIEVDRIYSENIRGIIDKLSIKNTRRFQIVESIGGQN